MRARRLEALQRRLVAQGSPRLTMSLVIALAGGAAFLTSFGLLSAGLRAMGVRYVLATLVGYVAFLLLIKAWVSWQRRTANLELDGPPDFSTDGGSADPPAVEPFSGGGGDFGGAGASGGWSEPTTSTAGLEPSSQGGGSAIADFFSLEDAWPVLIAAALALLAGAIAVGFVIYNSPILFAEVLLDAVVLRAVYRRTRRHDASHWLGGVLGRTALPTIVLCVFMGILGAALQVLAPDATSIGGVVRSVVNGQP